MISTATARPRRELVQLPACPTSPRVYLAHFDVHRYSGSGGASRFLADLRQCASPDVAALADGRPLSPIATHPSVDTWTDRAYSQGAVLVGDAAGYNDPIIGQGLSLTMADVLTCRGDSGEGPGGADFSNYSRTRRDRHANRHCVTDDGRTDVFLLHEHASRRLRRPAAARVEAMALAAPVCLVPKCPPGTEFGRRRRQGDARRVSGMRTRQTIGVPGRGRVVCDRNISALVSKSTTA